MKTDLPLCVPYGDGAGVRSNTLLLAMWRRATRRGSVMAVVVTLAGVLAAPTMASADGAPARLQGRALSWGANGYGQLGNGVIGAPVAVPGFVVGPGGSVLSGVRSVSGGSAHSLALLSGGRVRAWGYNDQGQLGNGGNGTNKPRPGAVVGPGGRGQLTRITSLAAGDVHSLAIGRGGRVWAWGDNIWGELGVGTSTGPQHCPVGTSPPSDSDVCSKVPVAVVGPDGQGTLRDVIAVAAGANHSVALRADGTVWTWGLNDLGQLGIGESTGPLTCKPYEDYGPAACSPEPVQVVGPDGLGHLGDIVAVAAGSDYSLALRKDGTVWAWGSDQYADLGQPGPTPLTCNSPFAPIPLPCSSTPLEVVGPDGTGHLSDVSAISAEGSPQGLHVLALCTDGTVWSWGVDDKGQLGNGLSETQSLLPVQVVGPNGEGQLSDVVDIAAGGGFSLALRADGSVWAWGDNNSGELGIGNTTGPEQCTTDNYPCSTIPVQVVGPSGTGTLGEITAIAAGQLHGLALRGSTE